MRQLLFITGLSLLLGQSPAPAQDRPSRPDTLGRDSLGQGRQNAGQRIVRLAGRDVGYQERTNRNDHPIYSYYRAQGRGSNRPNRRGHYQPTCGFAVYAWHRQAGLRPRMAAPGRALAWSRVAPDHQVRLGRRAAPGFASRLDTGMVILFRFGRGYHVGVAEAIYPLYGHTIEANTSLSNAIGHYGTGRYGVIRKMRFWAMAQSANDWRDSPPADSLAPQALRRSYLRTTKKPRYSR